MLCDYFLSGETFLPGGRLIRLRESMQLTKLRKPLKFTRPMRPFPRV